MPKIDFYHQLVKTMQHAPALIIRQDLTVIATNNPADNLLPLFGAEHLRRFTTATKPGFALIDQVNYTFQTLALIRNDTETYHLVILHPLSNQQAQQQVNSLFKNIINNLPQYIFWKNKDSVFTGCNDNFAKLLGLKSAHDLIGKSDFDLPWSTSQAQLYRNDDHQIMLGGKPRLYYEETQRDFAGKERVVLVSKIPLFEQEGQATVTGLAGIYEDITEVKELELALINSTLNAEAANRSKSEFIANISHDIRTPITGMLGLAQHLKDTALSMETHNCADLLINSTQELLTLLNEVIDIIDLDPSEPNQHRELFSPHKIVAHNMTLLGPAAQHKGLLFQSSIAPNVPLQLYGHRIFFDRILLNLLSNAVKFTNAGRVDVTVDLNQCCTDQVELLIQVKDTGIGIPASQLTDIFECYARLASSSYQIYKGSGLGLYVVKQYLDAVGGAIEVKSKLGYGSCFSVRFPLTLMPHMTNQPAQKKAFVLEDSPITEFMAQQLLQQLGYNAIPIRQHLNLDDVNEDETLWLVSVRHPAVAKGLPAQIGTLNGSRLIGTTAHPLSSVEQDYYERLGFSALLSKPLSVRSLSEALAATEPLFAP